MTVPLPAVAAELKLRAERELGKWLAQETVKGGRRHKSHDGICERARTLPEKVSLNDSSRWQAIAAIEVKRRGPADHVAG